MSTIIAARTGLSAGNFRRVFRRTSESGVLTPEVIWQEFLYALRDFSFGTALLEDDHENAPHILAANRIKAGNFRRNLGGYSQNLLECVFEEGSRHCVGASFAAAAGGQGRRMRLGLWRDMHDIVARKLSGFDTERSEAFHILIDACRAWQIVAHEDLMGRHTRVRGRSADLWHETLGGLLIRLPRAMEILWKAYPCADPLVEEGVQICFDDTPGLRDVLTEGRALRRARHSDAEIDDVMNAAATHVRFASHELGDFPHARHIRDPEMRRDHATALRDFTRALRRAIALRAVAEKYLENLETLRPLAGRIAYRTATIFESRPRHMQENWGLHEFGTMKDEAKSEILFAHCRDLRSGTWFEGRKTRVLQSLTLMNHEIFLCARTHADMVAVNPDGSVSTTGDGIQDLPLYGFGAEENIDTMF